MTSQPQEEVGSQVLSLFSLNLFGCHQIIRTSPPQAQAHCKCLPPCRRRTSTTVALSHIIAIDANAQVEGMASHWHMHPPYSTMQLSSLKARNGRAKEESWQIRSTHGACTSASPCRLVRVVKRKIRFHFSVMRRRGRGLIRAQVCRGGGGGTVCVMADDQILSLLAAVAAAALLLPGLMMRGLFQMACCEE